MSRQLLKRLLMKNAAESVAYHYAPKSKLESVGKHGLLSLRGLREAGLSTDYRENLDKYRDRVTKGLNLKRPATDAEVEQWLSELRGTGWDEWLYAFKQPIPDNAATPFLDFVKNHKLFKVRVPEKSDDVYQYIPDQTNIDFSKPPEGAMLFKDIPHLGLRVGTKADVVS